MSEKRAGNEDYIVEPAMVAGITFRDHTLLQRALTHRSYLNEHPQEALEDNERLEFLGDAVLSMIVAQYLYHRFPEYREGELTRLRASLVRRETLADFAVRIGLNKRLLVGRGEEESGARSRPAILCDAFEAFVGALYLDQGYEVTAKLVEPLVQEALEAILATDSTKDARSELQELTQARFQITPRYRTVGEHGPDHAKEFIVEAYIGEHCYGRGRGPSKQAAAKMAAAEALARLRLANHLSETPPLLQQEQGACASEN